MVQILLMLAVLFTQDSKVEEKKRKLVLYPTRQLVAVILYAKYELSILYSCGDIFDKNVERKKKRTYTRKTNRRMSILNSTMQQVIVNLHTNYEPSVLNSC